MYDMEQVRLLESLTEKTAPGRTPDYTRPHVLYLMILLRKQRMGRKQLSAELRLGEGTIRTLLGRLQDEGLIEVSRPGATLSEKGRVYLENIESLVRWTPVPSSDSTVDQVDWAVLVNGASEKVRYGVEQRDQALIHGATGATTLVFVNGSWDFPGIESKIDDVIIKRLDTLNPVDGDVVVIGTSEERLTAAIGALAAAIDLLD